MIKNARGNMYLETAIMRCLENGVEVHVTHFNVPDPRQGHNIKLTLVGNEFRVEKVLAGPYWMRHEINNAIKEYNSAYKLKYGNDKGKVRVIKAQP